jgi:hypothetical protein
MALSVTTALNFDDAGALAYTSGSTITVNGGALTINSDNAWAQNAAVLGSMTISATLGGSILIDGRDVWWAPYDAPTGNIPALGTAGTPDVTRGGSPVAEFLGIWTGYGVNPSAAGGAIPATGYIKFRSVSSALADNGVLTLTGGATVTINSATGGQRGWLRIVGRETGTATIPRLGTFQTRGDWFYLGTATGLADETFQYPILDVCPAVQVETSAGSGVYEWWLHVLLSHSTTAAITAVGRWGNATVTIPTDARGKYFSQAVQQNGSTTVGAYVSGDLYATSNILQFARRSANNCGQLLPAGALVRIPNIILCNTVAAAAVSDNLNKISNTIATRYDFTTTSAGDMSIRYATGSWYFSFTAAYAVDIQHVATFRSMLLSNIATTTAIDDLAIAPDQTAGTALAISNCFSGGTIANVRTGENTSAAGITFADCVGFVLTDCQVEAFGQSITSSDRASGGASTNGYQILRCNDMTLTRCTSIGHRFYVSASVDVTLTDSVYGDRIRGTTTSTQPPIGVFVVDANSNTVLFSGLTWFQNLTNIHAYASILSATNFSGVTLANIGSSASRLTLGSANQTGLVFTGSVGVDLTMYRIYVQNTRTRLYTLANTIQNVDIFNVWGDGADTEIINAVNASLKGGYHTYTTTGQASVYGTHWTDHFTAATTGQLVLHMHEPLAATAAQCVTNAGTPKFTSAGQVAMATLNDQVEWTTPYYVKGYTAFAGTITLTGTNTGNHTYEYQIDTGSGSFNGVWKLLTTGANLTGETITGATGFRFKIRITTAVASTTNALTYVKVDMVTTALEQVVQYDLPYTAAGSFTALVSGSRIQIYNDTTTTEIYNALVSGTTLTYDYYEGTGITAGDTIRMRLTLLGYLPYQARTVTSATGFSFLAEQLADSVYTTNAVDGSTVAECATDFVNDKIDINDGDDTTTVQRLYAFYRYAETLSTGIGDWFNGVLAVNTTTYVVSQATLDLTYNNIGVNPLRITGGRWTRADNSTIKYVTTNPIITESVTVSGLQAGSTLQIYNATTLNELYNAVMGGTSYQYDFSIGTDISVGNSVLIRVAKLGYLPFTTSGSASATETTFTAAQVVDSIYVTNAVDGTTVTECTANFGDTTIEIDDPDDTTTVQRIYAYYRVAEATITGIANWFGAVTANSVSSYTIDTVALNLKWNNVNVPGVVITGGRWDRSDASSIAFAGSGPILMEVGSVTAIEAGSRIQVYNLSSLNEIANEIVPGTSYTLNYENGTSITAADSIRIRLTLLGQLPYTSTVAATTSGFTLAADQLADSVYTTNAIDGSTVAECTANYVDNTIEINDGDDSTSIQRIYAFYRYAETTSAGIAAWHAGITAVDTTTYQVIVANVDLTLDNTNVAALSLTLAGGRLTRSDASSYIFATSNAINMEWGVISNIVTGSRLQIYNTTTAAELYNATVAGTSYSYNYNNSTEITSGNSVRIRLTLVGRLPVQTTATATASGFTVTADQSELDTVYTSNAIDGSTVAECAADYADDTIDITDADDTTTVQRIYAWFRYNETTSLGIASDWFNGMSAVDDANYLITVATIDLTLNNLNATPLLITNARLYRSDGTTVIFATSNSIQMDPDKVYAIATGGSALTPTESTVLLSLSGLKPLVVAGL